MSRSGVLNVERLLLIVAGVYAVVVCVRDEIVARRETAPTAIDMANFARDYQGQQWLSLTGKLDWDLARSGRAGSWVALVDPQAGPSDPVHVFVRTSSAPSGSAPLRRDQPVTLTGTQIFFDAAKLFPNVRRGEPFVMLQPGSKPDPPGRNLRGAVLFAVIALLAVVVEVRAWLLRKHRATGASD